jgi:hypothetical protein
MWHPEQDRPLTAARCLIPGWQDWQRLSYPAALLLTGACGSWQVMQESAPLLFRKQAARLNEAG